MSITVEDHVAIQRLMYAYGHCADAKDYAGFADIFCEDAVFEYRGEPVTPLAAIQDMMLALEKYTHTLHQVTNVLYEVEGDSATGETYCLASHLFEDDGRSMKIDMGVVYSDTLCRRHVGWRIQNRQFKLLWSQTAPVD